MLKRPMGVVIFRRHPVYGWQLWNNYWTAWISTAWARCQTIPFSHTTLTWEDTWAELDSQSHAIQLEWSHV